MRRFTASTCALAIALLPACKQEPAASGDPSPAATPAATPTPTPAEGAKDKATAEADKPTSKPLGLADIAMKAVAKDIAPGYPMELDPLLNLVPADADAFLVIRDAKGIADTLVAVLEVEGDALSRMRGLLPADSSATSKAELEKFEKQLATFETELAKSGIDLSLGVVMARVKGGEDIVVYGAAKADALPMLMQTLGAEKSPKAEDCRPLTEVAGYSVCAESKLAGYAPGSSAATLRARAQKALPGFEIERANILAVIEDDGEEIAFAVETGQGMAHFALAAPSLRAQLGDKIAAGPAPALGLVGPDKPFLWGRVNKGLLDASTRGGEPMMAKVAATLTGEMVLGGIAGTGGYFFAAGVDDPTPISGLTSLASLAFSKVPKTLPDGTGLELELANVTVAGAPVPTIKGRFTAGPALDLTKSLGYEPAFFAFAAGKYGAATFGTKEDVVSTIGEYSAAAPTEAQLGALPVPLRQALLDGKVAVAGYLPLDSMHAPAAAEMYKALLDHVPASERPPVDMVEAVAVATAFFAPLSSFSGWISDVDTGPVVHIAVEGFFETGTAEGRAAIAAMTAVVRGADAKATYGALASEYASSPFVHRYRARAGEIGHAIDSVLALGIMGAAFAGFTAYALTKKAEAPPVSVAVPQAGG